MKCCSILWALSHHEKCYVKMNCCENRYPSSLFLTSAVRWLNYHQLSRLWPPVQIHFMQNSGEEMGFMLGRENQEIWVRECSKFGDSVPKTVCNVLPRKSTAASVIGLPSKKEHSINNPDIRCSIMSVHLSKWSHNLLQILMGCFWPPLFHISTKASSIFSSDYELQTWFPGS